DEASGKGTDKRADWAGDRIADTRLAIVAIARVGIGHDRVVARNEGKAAEIRDVVELGDAGIEALVAARGDGEGIANCNVEGHGLPELERYLGAGVDVGLDLDGCALVGA